MALDPQDLFKQYTKIVEQRRVWEFTWRELAAYILPRKSSVIGGSQTPGAKQTTNLFDATAIHANELLAANMQGSLTPSTVKWFRLRMRERELNEIEDVVRWLDEAANRIYAAFQSSNLNSELQEVYLDLGTFGFGGMLQEEGERPGSLRFEAMAPGTYAVSEGPDGRVDTVYREIKMPAKAALARWKENTGEKIRIAFERDPYQNVSILHAVFPRQGARGSSPRRRPYASFYASLEGDKHIISESGFFELPFLVPRWTKSSGEVYGRGPGHTALPDVRTLNKAVELTLKAWAKALDPPLLVRDDGVIGSLRARPADVITVRDMDAVKPLEGGARFDVAQVESGVLRQAIRDTFFQSQLFLPSNQPMTATEVERRIELMQRVLGPTLGRLESELLGPMVERAFNVLFRAGEIAPPPDVLVQRVKKDQGTYDIEYEGPLARAQKASDILSVQRLLEFTLPLVSIDPEVADTVDFAEAVRFVGRASGVSPDLFRSAKDVAVRQQQRAQAAAEEKQRTDLAGVADAAGKAAPMVKAVSPEGVDMEALAQATQAGAL